MQTTELRESLTKVIYGAVISVVLWILWHVAATMQSLRGLSAGRIPGVALVQLVIAVVVIGVLLGILPSLRAVVAYYIGLGFHLKKSESGRELEPRLVGAAGGIIGFVYLAIAYGLAFGPFALMLFGLLGPPSISSAGWLLWLVRIGFLVILVVLVVRIWRDLQPVVQSLTRTVADRAVAATERVAYRDCPSCGARNDVSAKFCAKCGKTMPEEKREAAAEAKPATCPKCNTQLAPGARFCPSCGQEITTASQQ